MKKIRVRWCDGTEPEWKGRANIITTPNEVIRLPVPDDAILCDYCNRDLIEAAKQGHKFAVIGNDACCQVCAENIYGVKPGQTSVG